MKKILAILLTSVLLVSMFAVAASAAWDDESQWTTDEETGNVAFGDAYGYEFTINYVDGSIVGEDATIITNADAYAACNPNWAISVALKATDNANEYSVVKVVECPGSAAAADLDWSAIDLVMVIHSASSNPADASLYANWASKVAAVALKADDLVVINEDMTKVNVLDPADFEEPKPEAPAPISFWFTHYNDLTAEGAGVIVLEEPTDENKSVWNDYYAFAPVEGLANVYEIVEISRGDCVGTAVYTAIPEGGFVYSLNTGNDYADLYEQDPVQYGWCAGMPNYTSEACSAMIALAKNWEVGMQFVVDCIDFEGVVIPTSTPDVLWYEEGYVCTAEITEYIGQALEGEDEEDTSKEETSKDEASKDETSKDETSKKPTTPATGDASSMIVFALLAIVAVAGSAVVIKNR